MFRPKVVSLFLMLSRPTKALLYADWCAVRPLLGRYLLLFGLWCPLMAPFVADGEPGALGEETWGALVGLWGSMAPLLALVRLFTVDESNGWDAGHLPSLGRVGAPGHPLVSALRPVEEGPSGRVTSAPRPSAAKSKRSRSWFSRCATMVP